MGNNISTLEEKFLYDLMTILSKNNVPIVFKGAMVLKVIQYQCGNPSGLERETHDLDGDWVGDKPSMSFLTKILQNAVDSLGSPLRVESYREYGKNKSAGFNFIRLDNGDLFVTMDLSIKKNNCIQKYSYINGISFYGQSVDKILVDKISVCASRYIFRRIKDIIDLYILSYCWKGYSTSLIELSVYLSRPFDDLSGLTKYYNELEHAYSRYKNKVVVLPFNIIHTRVIKFLQPFISKSNETYYWNGDNWVLCESRTKIWN